MKKILLIVSTMILSLSASADNPQDKLEKMQQQAREVIAKMTVGEKISQLMNDASGVPRLGIKPYNWWSEALHGVARDGRATVYPQPICLASTFDEALVHDIAEQISLEGRAKYLVAQRLKNFSIYAGLTFWSPNVNIFRDPRWGRGMETYGEDPYLSGQLGSAFVRGMQGDDPVYLRVSACAKHFAVHSGPESTRHTANINPSRRDLYETYLPAFRKLVEDARVESVMGAYNSLYSESCSGSKFLLTDILRNEWGFQGHVVSDCGAVSDIFYGHKIASSPAEAAAIAIKSGLNLECGSTFSALQEALDKGLLTEADLDNALMPLMMTRLKLGILYDDPDCPYNNVDESVICAPAHAATARQAALEGMVLLKNDDVLPVDKNVRTLYVVGPAATDAFYLMGNYYGLSNRYSTYLEGIVGKVSNGTSINFRPGFNSSYTNRNNIDWTTGDAVSAEVTVMIMGNNGNLEGEEGEAIESGAMGDRTTLSLPESQMRYFRTLAEAHKKTNGRNKLITVVTGGSPVDLKEIAECSDAVIFAWYPGQEGGAALGDLLFGDASFSGRLPVTFPEDVDRLPDFEDYNMQGRTYKYMADNIQYPFGYGLTYGRVSYSDAAAAATKNSVTLTATVTNSGRKACDEVVQLYHSAPGAGQTSPIASLCAFKRVHLEPGQKTEVAFTLDLPQLATVQPDGTSKVLKGLHTLTVGGAAPSPRTEQLGVSTATVTFKMK